MTDYKKLVDALRCYELRLSCNECEYGKWHDDGNCWYCEEERRDNDAAAAIEALLKENKELIEDHHEMVEADGHWEWRKPNGEVLMPKLGEVVRCGECKYHLPETERTNPYCNRFHCMRTDDWFCADGEREVQDAENL